MRLATGQQIVTTSYLTAPFHGPFGEAARDTESLEWPNQQSAFLDRSPFPMTEVKCNGATSCMVTVVTDPAESVCGWTSAKHFTLRSTRLGVRDFYKKSIVVVVAS